MSFRKQNLTETFYKIQIVSFYFDVFNIVKNERNKSYP